MSVGWGILAGLSLLIAAARNVPTASDLQWWFEEGQKFYASGAYDQAVEKYGLITAVESRFLETDSLSYAVGEISAPVRDVALYQTGNSYFKMAREELELARRAASEQRRDRHRESAREHRTLAIRFFEKTEGQTGNADLQELARNRIVKVLYESGDYERTIREARRLIERYPESRYTRSALYDIGWSYYELEEYGPSVEAFEELVARFPSGYQHDRALFHIGESHYSKGRYREALPYYQRLVELARIDQLTDEELARMRREKIADLVDETVLELAMKSQIRAGSCYANLGEYENAAEVYRSAIGLFTRERSLAEEAYRRLADMYQQAGQFDRAVAIYREAIDWVADPAFGVGGPSLLGERYYQTGRFEEAIDEYRLYMGAYADAARAAGFGVDEARYKVGRSYYELARGQRESGDSRQAVPHLLSAVDEYEAVLEEFPDSWLGLACHFNIGLSYQTMDTAGGRARAMEKFDFIAREHPRDEYAPGALFQIARMHFNQGSYASAVETYERIVADYGDSPRLDTAFFELAIARKKAGLDELAVGNFLGIGTESALYVKARHEAAQLLMAMGKFDRALEELAGALALAEGPERGLNHYLQGKALVGREAYAEAALRFGEALELLEDPGLAESVRYSRGVCLMQLERYAEAEALLVVLTDAEDLKVRRAAQRMLGKARIELHREEQALENYRILAEEAADPAEKAEYLLLLAELYHGLERDEDAARLARQVIGLPFADTRAEQGDYFIKERAFYLLGDTFVRRGMHEAAIETYAEALGSYPSGFYAPDMRFAVASSRMQLDDLDRATDSFEAFIREFGEDPNLPYAYYYAAYSHFNLTRFERSASLFSEMASRFPGLDVTPDALYRAGESCFNLGRFEESLSYYQRILDEHPQSDQVDGALYNKAWALLERDRGAEAAAVFRQLVERFPDSEFGPSAQFSIGDYHYNQENYREALDAYRKVAELYPRNPLAGKVPDLIAGLRESLAFLDYQKAVEPYREAMADKDPEKFRRAIALFQQVVEQYPGTESHTGALVNMGICYESLNRWKEAVAAYDMVYQAYEDGKATAEAYQFARAHREWITANRL
ncbi:MAG: tetratricopeptide repeat protein [Gemmatimonadetes bacterium]|nr:tetratricopeptide repeat protein [Gemmatimonadota bacterium]